MPRTTLDAEPWLSGWTQQIGCDASENDEVDLFDDLTRMIGCAGADQAPLDRGGIAELWALIAASQRAGWRLTRGFPSGNAACFYNWFGPRLVLSPAALQGVPVRGVISSRLSRALDTLPDWFFQLRAAVADTLDQEFVMVFRQAAGAALVGRAAELFGKRPLYVHLETTQNEVTAWLGTCLRRTTRPSDPDSAHIYVSPPFAQCPPALDEIGCRDIPSHDRMLVAGCDTLHALYVRNHGNFHRLLRIRLAHESSPRPWLRVAIGCQTPASVHAELMDAGAVGWALPHPQPTLIADGQAHDVPSRWTRTPQWLADGHYLTHCTRRRAGPWPDQTEREYCDDLILRRDDANHSALAALRRIARTKRLIAGGTAVRGNTAVVSFTAVPLSELHALRVFRPHRGRWDFEPYGLCIEREALRRLGARPVSYVRDTGAQPSSDLPYHQKARSTTRGGSAIDWTVECEWRHHGDVCLDQIANEAICLFVPTSADAAELRPLVPWPVLILPRRASMR